MKEVPQPDAVVGVISHAGKKCIIRVVMFFELVVERGLALGSRLPAQEGTMYLLKGGQRRNT
jgi:hypothetical protein